MPGVLQDVAYALRLFRRAPGFTAVVILTLALGIGANTAVFSILHAVLLAPLPYRQPSRLVAIWDREIHPKGVSKLFDLYSDYENWKQGSQSFESAAGVTWATQTSHILTGRGPARSVMTLPVTADFFALLGVEPMLGRTFRPDDASRGCTVVLADGFWRNLLGAPVNIAGETLRLDDQACTVLGVMPPRFAFLPPEAPVTMWILLARPARPDQLGVGVFGRLRPGVSLEAAQQEVLARHRQLHAHDDWGKQVEPVVYDLHGEFTWLTGRNLRLSLIVLFWAVTFVLLIACVNVANLLLGRAAGRQREMALRAALGSGRARLVRQMLTESLLLSAAASVAGALLAAAAVDYFRVARPVEIPPGTLLSLDAPVLAFTALLSLLTAVAFGIVPAWKASRTDLREALKTGGKASAGLARQRLGKVLIVAEVTLTMMLLSGAGLLVQTLDRFRTAPLGFQPDGLLTASVHLPKTSYPDAARRAQFYQRLETALAAMPGVQSAALSSAHPFLGGGAVDMIQVEGQPEPTAGNLNDTFVETIGPDYFRVMSTPLEQGRFFDAGDTAESEPVAIINQALARKYFAGRNPIGSHIRPVSGGRHGDPWMRVVGVVGNQKRTTVYQEMAWVDEPIFYRPVLQNPGGSVSLIVRASTVTGSAIQRAIAALDPDVPVDEIQPVRNLEARALSYPRFRAALLAGFAALAMLLALVGLFGVLSHIVTQRTHEIGVRMALGAPRGKVLAMVLRQGLALTAAGIALGMAGASLLGRYLVTLLYGVRPVEPLLLAAVALLLMAAAFAAVWMPARRAAQVDPMVALKYE